MDYLKIIIPNEKLAEWETEMLMPLLGDIGFESFMESDQELEAFIPKDNFNSDLLKELIISQFPNSLIQWKKELIKDQNWNEVWEKNYFKPLVVKDKIVVRAPFHKDYPKYQYEIVIEPNMAFGTGNHETTTLMMEAILNDDYRGKQVLDMGCGTGILSILSSMLGAKSVIAIDIDKWSFEATAENAILNNINNIESLLGDASLLKKQKFDIILANIQRNILLKDMDQYNRVLKNGGKLIMSGFYKEDAPSIKSKAESIGLTDLGYSEKNSWVAYSFQKN